MSPVIYPTTLSIAFTIHMIPYVQSFIIFSSIALAFMVAHLLVFNRVLTEIPNLHRMFRFKEVYLGLTHLTILPFVIGFWYYMIFLPTQLADYSDINYKFILSLKMISFLEGAVMLVIYKYNCSIQTIIDDYGYTLNTFYFIYAWIIAALGAFLYFIVRAIKFHRLFNLCIFLPVIIFIMTIVLIIFIFNRVASLHSRNFLERDRKVRARVSRVVIFSVVSTGIAILLMVFSSIHTLNTLDERYPNIFHYISSKDVEDYYELNKYEMLNEQIAYFANPFDLKCPKILIREIWEKGITAEGVTNSYACLNKEAILEFYREASTSSMVLIILGAVICTSIIMSYYLEPMIDHLFPELASSVEYESKSWVLVVYAIIVGICLIVVGTAGFPSRDYLLSQTELTSTKTLFQHINSEIFDKSIKEMPLCNFTINYEEPSDSNNYTFYYHVHLKSQSAKLRFKGYRDGLFFSVDTPTELVFKGQYNSIKDLCKSIYANDLESDDNSVELTIKIRQEDNPYQNPMFEGDAIEDELEYNQNPFNLQTQQTITVGKTDLSVSVVGMVVDENMQPLNDYKISFVWENGHESQSFFNSYSKSDTRFSFTFNYGVFTYGFIRASKEGYEDGFKEVLMPPLSWNLMHVVSDKMKEIDLGKIIVEKIKQADSRNIGIYATNPSEDKLIPYFYAYSWENDEFKPQGVSNRFKEVQLALTSGQYLFKFEAKNYATRLKFIDASQSSIQSILLHPIKGGSLFTVVLYWNKKIRDLDIGVKFQASKSLCKLSPYHRECGGAVYNTDFDSDAIGEEAITFKDVGSSSYMFYVNKPSSEKISLADTEATLLVFVSHFEYPIYISHAPYGYSDSNYWKAFCINGKGGANSIISFNSFANEEPSIEECDAIYDVSY